jgi:hypothetical protein
MIQRSLGYMGLSQDYGSAHNVVKMRPNGAAPSGEYGGVWDYLTDKEYRKDYKAAKDEFESRSDAQEWAESAKENRELFEQAERDMQYIRDLDTSSVDTQPAQLEYRDERTGQKDNNGVLYVYRQFSNGDIAIMHGAPPSGWSLGKVGPRDAQWRAITDKIGPYPTGTIDKIISDAQSGARSFIDQVVGAVGGGIDKAAAGRVAGEQKSDNTALYVVAGVGGVLVLGLLGLALSRRGGN